MPAPAYQTKSSTGESYTDTFAPSVPSGTASGDLLIACCWMASYEIDTAPGGWTQALSVSNGSGTYLNVYWQIAGSSESTPTFTAAGESYGEVILYRLTGAHGSTPIDVTATDTGTLNAPSVTTTGADRFVLHLFGSSTSSGSSIAVPSGDTQLDAPSNFYIGLSSGYTSQATAGATGAAAFDDGTMTSDQITATLAIAPAAAAWAGPVYETMSTTGSVGGATISPNAPSGTEPGDLLIAFATATDNADWTTPSGWTLEEGGTRNAVLSRIATAAESSYSFAKSTSGGAAVSIYRFSNVYQNPTLSGVPAVHVSATASDSSSPALTAPSVTTTETNCLILRLLENNYASAAAEDPTIPAGTTEIEAVQYGTGNGFRIGAAYSEQAATGAAGTADWTVDAGVGNLYTIAIRPRETPTLSSAATLPTDLTAHWDDSASSSVGSNTLTQSNAANGTLTFGGGAKVGDWELQTYQAGGESGLYYLKNGTALALQAPFTVGLWTKLTAGGANAKTLLTLTGTDVDDITVTQPGGAGTQTATLQVGGVSLGSDSTNLSSWAFVAVRADGNGQLAMRLNGGSWQSGVHDAGQTYDELRVGQITTDGMAWSIDAISVFDRSLSDDEVDILYATGDGNQYPWRQLPQLTVEIVPQSLQPDVTDTTLPQLTVEIVPQPLQPTSVVTVLPQLTVEVVPQPLAGTLVSTALPQLTVEIAPQPLQPTPIVTTLPQLTVEIVPQTLQPTPIVTTLPQLTVEIAPQTLQPTPVVTTLPQLTVEIVPVELPTPALPQLTIEIVPLPLQPTPIVTTLPQLTVEVVPQTLQPDVTDTTLPQLTVEIVPQTLQPTPIVTVLPQLTVEVVPQPLQPDVTDTTLPQLTVEIVPLPLSGTPVSTTLPQLTVEIIPQTLQPTPIVTTLPQLTVAIVPLPPDITPTPIDATGLKLLNLANPGPLIVLPMITQDTGVAIGRLVDQDLAQFPLSGLHMALLTVWDQQSQELIRGSHNVLNAGTVAIAETEYSSDDITRLTWSIETRDTELVDITVAQGRETHRAVFEFAWNAERITTLVSPFAVTSGSPLVTVTAPSHGLEVKDSVAIVGSSAVGGLSLDGVHLVRSRIDDDTFTIEHRPRLSTITTDASATATGGGTPQLLIRPRKATHELKLQLSAADVT